MPGLRTRKQRNDSVLVHETQDFHIEGLEMEQVEAREGARRQHRAISLFCVVQCWLRGWDGVRIDRDQLERLLGIEKFKQARVAWMNEDFSEFFPWQQNVYDPGPPKPFWSIRLSRVPFNESPEVGMFEVWEQPSQKLHSDLHDVLRPFFPHTGNCDERLLSSYISLLAQGQLSPRAVPPNSNHDGGDHENRQASIVFVPSDYRYRDRHVPD